MAAQVEGLGKPRSGPPFDASGYFCLAWFLFYGLIQSAVGLLLFPFIRRREVPKVTAMDTPQNK